MRENGNLVYNLFTNFVLPENKNKLPRKTFQERILYIQEYTNILINKSINFVNKITFSIINNKVYHLKDILK